MAYTEPARPIAIHSPSNPYAIACAKLKATVSEIEDHLLGGRNDQALREISTMVHYLEQMSLRITNVRR